MFNTFSKTEYIWYLVFGQILLFVTTLIQAGAFYAPYYIWSILEGGLMQSCGTDGKSPVMIAEDMKYDDGVVMEAVGEKFVKYFKSIIHHNSWYFCYFVLCEYFLIRTLF